MQRQEKARSIRKMLTESTTSITKEDRSEAPETDKAKIAAERKEREHILSMNQILAKQVMEKSRLVAGESIPLIVPVLPAEMFIFFSVSMFFSITYVQL